MSAPRAAVVLPAVRRPRRRGVELALLGAAVLIPVYGYVDVGLARNGSVPSGAAGYGAVLAALALLAHLAVRLRAPYADPLLLPIAVLLNGIGLVLIYRLDLATPHEPGGADPAGVVVAGRGAVRRRSSCCCATTGPWPATATCAMAVALVLLVAADLLPGRSTAPGSGSGSDRSPSSPASSPRSCSRSSSPPTSRPTRNALAYTGRRICGRSSCRPGGCSARSW